ncbi:MAG: co-chaperone DjlA [Natronospirillum sp.]|uniref:co-chaperone DjlA n=1 Tax=Natronospirillum sp. TaxID=2812955 RepID=UPI0025E77D3E|nr:co-chaperone DjlA [Natronospirillum sp.]MCH8552592.1 co-chaperone DjlA [Natronospirillum sp.]
MFWWGKAILAVLGFYRGGPAGLVFGLVVGHMIDVGLRRWWLRRQQRGLSAEDRQRFFIGTFEFMGHLAKSKGRVEEVDIDFARRVMRRLGLGREHTEQAMQAFQQGKTAEFNREALLADLRARLSPGSPLALIFLETQIEAAYADGRIGDTDKALLADLCKAFRLSRLQYEQTRHLVRSRLARERRARRPGQPEAAMSRQQAREILGVAPDASASEIKKAYRRAMNQHHPDKLVAKGLPESMQRIATERVQQLQSAYEILSKRGDKKRSR